MYFVAQRALLFGILVAIAACGSDEPEVPEAAGWAQPGLVTDVAWLSANAERVVMIDAREASAYDAGHLPGAVNLTWQQLAQMTGAPGDPDWGTVLEKTALEAQLQAVGVDKTTDVVVYADPPGGWGEDGRVVWLLRMHGVGSARMLDGGYAAWTGAGRATATDRATPVPTTGQIDPVDGSWLAETAWVESNLLDAAIVDSRGADEYAGAQNFGEARGGHLPGAISIPFGSVFDDEGFIKTQAQLVTLFTDAGLTPDVEIVTYCTAGIRSGHLAVVLRLAGFAKARNYDESFYRWAADVTLPLE